MSLRGAKIDLINAKYHGGDFYICMDMDNYNSLSEALHLLKKPIVSMTKISTKSMLKILSPEVME